MVCMYVCTKVWIPVIVSGSYLFAAPKVCGQSVEDEQQRQWKQQNGVVLRLTCDEHEHEDYDDGAAMYVCMYYK